MERKVINGEEDLEYVCPECGGTFSEGDSECPTCHVEFDWSEELEYLCPECGTIVDPDQDICPGCEAKFSKDANGEMVIEYEPDPEPPTVDQLLDTAINEVMVRPNGTPDVPEVEEEEEEKEGPEAISFEDLEATEEGGEESEDGPALATSEIQDSPDEGTDQISELYPGGFTKLGILFLFLALISLVFTVFMARYDTWIQGAAEESMGTNQKYGFLAGLGGFTVFILMAVYDLMRAPKEPLEASS
jgi:RNA polymerase subunit RPABC4/transcription elongation factor Spt4